MQVNKFHEYKTDIELIIFNLLKEENINFVFQFPIRCKYGYISDFYLPESNLIIEADGEPFHNKKKDNAKTNVLKSMGYNIIRFKGKEIRSNPSLCLEKIKTKIDERRYVKNESKDISEGQRSCSIVNE